MLTPSPIRTPTSRSVSTMATTVTTNGANCGPPSDHIRRNRAGLASFTPVTSRIAARQDSGIRFSQAAASATLVSSSTPWNTAAAWSGPRR
jgi:hypothetical protein